MMKYISRIIEILLKLLEVNWFKTLYFNFRKFPFKMAYKLPVFFYGKVTFTDISGKFIFACPIETGMIAFGKTYVKNKTYLKISELSNAGIITFKGHAQFGKDCFLCVDKNGILTLGDMFSLGNRGKIVCTSKITFEEYVRFGPECQIIDSNFHRLIDTITGEKFKLHDEVALGSYNYFPSRASVYPGTKTTSYCTVASNSMLNKDYTALGENILIGGMPAKLLRKNISRDWEGEKNLFEYMKKIV
jgi:acetyltransferase-like isoleucine patch superfamily enzyme